LKTMKRAVDTHNKRRRLVVASQDVSSLSLLSPVTPLPHIFPELNVHNIPPDAPLPLSSLCHYLLAHHHSHHHRCRIPSRHCPSCHPHCLHCRRRGCLRRPPPTSLKHFIPIKNKMIRCPLRRPRPLRHPPPSSPSPSLLLSPSPSPFAFDPRHRRSPTTAVALAIALVAVARLHRRLHCCCLRHSPPLRHPSPSLPSPSPTLLPLPSPSSPSLALVANALAAVALALFVARHPRRSNILFQLRIK
jgi:hypothetical protein